MTAGINARKPQMTKCANRVNLLSRLRYNHSLVVLVTGALVDNAGPAMAQTASSPTEAHIGGHGVSAEAGLAFLGNTGSQESQAKNWGTLLRLGYSYGIRRVDVGVDVSYWYMYPLPYEEETYHYLIPAIVLRPHFSLDAKDQVELGVRLRAGVLIMHIDGPGTWLGYGFLGGPDMRLWVGPHWAVQLGCEFALGKGHNPSDRVTSTQNFTPDQGFLAVGFLIGGTARF